MIETRCLAVVVPSAATDVSVNAAAASMAAVADIVFISLSSRSSGERGWDGHVLHSRDGAGAPRLARNPEHRTTHGATALANDRSVVLKSRSSDARAAAAVLSAASSSA